MNFSLVNSSNNNDREKYTSKVIFVYDITDDERFRITQSKPAVTSVNFAFVL
jgi:hypothetical protein